MKILKVLGGFVGLSIAGTVAVLLFIATSTGCVNQLAIRSGGEVTEAGAREQFAFQLGTTIDKIEIIESSTMFPFLHQTVFSFRVDGRGRWTAICAAGVTGQMNCEPPGRIE